MGGCSYSSLCHSGLVGHGSGAAASKDHRQWEDVMPPATPIGNGSRPTVPPPEIVTEAVEEMPTQEKEPPKRMSTLEGVDHDPGIWHGREAANQAIRRHAREQEEAMLQKGSGLGMLQGVIIPCMSNILGVVLFLRLPWIIGKAGLLEGFCLVFLCCLCTFVTTLSLSAVATNGKIQSGGSYYLISRSLGPALGAGVGLCFYMANSIGAAMYFMGTIEAWEIAAPDYQLLPAGDLNNIRLSGFIMLGVALLCVAGGIKYVARLSGVFLLTVLFVILFMYLGCFVGPQGDGAYEIESANAEGDMELLKLSWTGLSGKNFRDNFGSGYDRPQKAFPLDTTDYSFIGLMALWFPAVTGIMAGSNRSADLADPSGSIPKGTLTAQLLTSVIYLSFTLLYGCVAPRETLLDDKFFASSSAWPVRQVVIFGVMASTIGAGFQSLVSGTRLLSAIALDRTLPILSIFAAKPGKEPRLALVASGLLCACAIAIGELNAVAPVLTMFFLMCYTCVNLSCAMLEAVNDPNWRPRFRFHRWYVSLAGAILCVWMMFAISALIAMCAMLFCMVVFAYAAYNSNEVKWGDGFQGIKFQLVRNVLTRLDLKVHTKNWRPQLLVITEASLKENEDQEEVLLLHDPELLKLVSQLKGGRGFVMVGGICSARGADVFSEGGLFMTPHRRQQVSDGQDAMQKLLSKYGIEGFGRLVYTQHFVDGLMCLVQICGLGAFQPNCVMAAWPQDWVNKDRDGEVARTRFIRTIQVSVAFQKVMLVAKGLQWPNFDEQLSGSIDIWWIIGDGGIVLLLPFLLKKHRVWHNCTTRLWVLADKVGDDPNAIDEELKTYIRDFRLDIEVHVKVVDPEEIVAEDEEDATAVSREPSRDGPENTTLVRMSSPTSTVSNEFGATIRRFRSGDTALALATPRGVGGFPQEPPGTIGSTGSGRNHRISAMEIDFTTQLSGRTPLPSPMPAEPRSMAAEPRTMAFTYTWEQHLAKNLVEELESQCRAAGLLENDWAAGLKVRDKHGNDLDIRFRVCEVQFPVRVTWKEARLTDPLTAASSSYFGPRRPESNENTLHSGAMRREVSGAGALRKAFMASTGGGADGASTKPCSREELRVAKDLNRFIVEESKDANLVVTNLPDMPPGETAYGYFQFVEAMTAGLQRCMLVRGTTMEVITAFT